MFLVLDIVHEKLSGAFIPTALPVYDIKRVERVANGIHKGRANLLVFMHETKMRDSAYFRYVTEQTFEETLDKIEATGERVAR